MLFITVTCPSRMHPWLLRSCKRNSKFDGTLPSQAQQHFCKTWSRICAQLKRDGINIYGFRVAEPHHDGTPHWHLLVFLPPHQLASLQKGRYGDPIGNKTIGVQSGDLILKTRIHVWRFMTLPKQKSPSIQQSINSWGGYCGDYGGGGAAHAIPQRGPLGVLSITVRNVIRR